MLAVQLKNYLNSVPDEAKVLMFVHKTGEVGQLIDRALDRDANVHIIIDAEYDVPPKHTTMQKGAMK